MKPESPDLLVFTDADGERSETHLVKMDSSSQVTGVNLRNAAFLFNFHLKYV